MKQRALFDEEIVTLTEEMREEAKVICSESTDHKDIVPIAIKPNAKSSAQAAHHKAEDEKRKLETQVAALKEKLEANGIGSICWSIHKVMSSYICS